MAGMNPVFNKIDRETRNGSYAGFNEPQRPGYGQQTYPPQDQRAYGQPGYGQPGYGQGGYVPPTQEQLDQMYQRPSAGPLDTGRVTYDDVIMKTLALFALVVLTAGFAWYAVSVSPGLVTPLWYGGMFGGLAVGLFIAFKKKISVPLIALYAVLEGLFIGALSRVLEAAFPGIVMTAVVATLATFGGMLIGYKMGFIRVTAKSRRIFGMMLIGYLLFSLVNLLALMVGWTSGWGFGGNGLLGIGISLLGVGLASYSLAIDFDTIDEVVRRGAPQKYSWLLAHGLIVSLVWLYIEILRLLARLRGD